MDTLSKVFQFQSSLEKWDVSSVSSLIFLLVNMEKYFTGFISFGCKQGRIHLNFSRSKWPHDWRQYVVLDDSNSKPNQHMVR